MYGFTTIINNLTFDDIFARSFIIQSCCCYRLRFNNRKLLYDNEVVIGASVFVVNSRKKNCLSDINGNFVLGLDSLPLKIEVHYVGCKYVSFDVTEENYNQFFQITLVEDPNLPEGIVEIYEPSKKAKKKQRKEK